VIPLAENSMIPTIQQRCTKSFQVLGAEAEERLSRGGLGVQQPPDTDDNMAITQSQIDIKDEF